MKILLLAVGRLRNKAGLELCQDYLARLQRYGSTEIREVKDAQSGSSEDRIQQEGERLLAAVEASDAVTILDERGAQMSSPELSQSIQAHEMRGAKRMVFVIGGAYGLSESVKKRGKLFSLSKMTLPHELCRVLLLEQLYRARTIHRGEPYHHG